MSDRVSCGADTMRLIQICLLVFIIIKFLMTFIYGLLQNFHFSFRLISVEDAVGCILSIPGSSIKRLQEVF